MSRRSPPKGRAARDADPEALKNHGFAKPRRLTDADADASSPCFTGDGSAVLVSYGRTDGPESLRATQGAADGCPTNASTTANVDAADPVADETTWFLGN